MKPDERKREVIQELEKALNQLRQERSVICYKEQALIQAIEIMQGLK